MLVWIYILIFIGIYSIYYAFTKGREKKISISDKIGIEKNFRRPNPALVIFAPLTRVLFKGLKAREALKGKLLTAKTIILPEEFLAIKLIFTIAFSIIAFMVFGKKPIWTFFGAMLGFVLPDLWLNRKIMAHRASIQRVLPETIDLLSLCIGAGLDFTGAVKWITEKAKPNPMTEELKAVLSEIKVGKPRLEALKDMAKRLNILDVSSFVHNLILAERMGTPVEETFAILSDDIRFRRVQRGERQALKAPIKILIPLIFCILPIILIIVAGPVILKFMQGGLFEVVK